MKNELDKQAFKIKKSKKRKKEKDSNSSRDSLELKIQSFKDNNKITEKETNEGEKIKFFFNENSAKKNNTIISTKTIRNLNKEDFDFRDLLLNYVNQTGRTNENKSQEKKGDSVIFTKQNEVITLNGENETNKDEFSNQISETNSEYDNSKSLSDSIPEKKTEDLQKKLKENKNKKSVKNNDKINNNNKKKAIIKNNTITNKNNEKLSIKNKENKKNKKVIILSNTKIKNLEKNNDSIINSNHNKFTGSNKIRSSNTFTTGANTTNTQNTQNSSFKSLQLNLKKFNYEYLNLTDLSLQKKLMIQNRINSGKKAFNKEEKKNKEIKKDGENIFDKIKNINISLEVEKSYANYFMQIINLQKQRNYCKNMSNKNINNSKKEIQEKKTFNKKHYYKRNFYYPDEFYIDKDSDIHSKSHVSTFFQNLKKNY